MDSKGALSVKPGRQSKRIALLAGLWLSVILVLGFWWATIVLRQSERIAELSLRAGIPQAEALAEVQRTERMLFWESGTFLFLLLTVSAALFWYYRRDMQRARGTQAFFAALTHELRTPLTSVRLQTEAIAAGEPSQELIERLLLDTHRLESQIDKTLELARIEGGGTLADQAIRFDQWLERVLRAIVSNAGDAAQLTVNVADSLPPIHGDTSAIQLILRNLVENSMRHGDQPNLKLDVTIAKPQNMVELRFRDNGCGYSGDANELGHLFLRGNQSRGTGVGLYLVRVLMERMGGTVTFSNAAAGGFETLLRFRPESAQ
jgi:signal transduction histidine kinase